jgi:hypothetical protein
MYIPTGYRGMPSSALNDRVDLVGRRRLPGEHVSLLLLLEVPGLRLFLRLLLGRGGVRLAQVLALLNRVGGVLQGTPDLAVGGGDCGPLDGDVPSLDRTRRGFFCIASGVWS